MGVSADKANLDRPCPSHSSDHGQLLAAVNEARRGDAGAFERLVGKTEKLARRIAFSIVDRSHIDDVLQESYLLVYRKLPGLQNPEAFLGWLSRIVLRSSYDILTKHPIEQELPASEGSRDHSEAVVSHLVLRQALRRLQQKDRDVLILPEVLGLNYEEIATALRLSVGTVKSRLHSARKNLSRRLAL